MNQAPPNMNQLPPGFNQPPPNFSQPPLPFQQVPAQNSGGDLINFTVNVVFCFCRGCRLCMHPLCVCGEMGDICVVVQCAFVDVILCLSGCVRVCAPASYSVKGKGEVAREREER